MKREFLQLAHTYDPKKQMVMGYFASEKLDGIRCFYDGGVSRGMPCDKIPWANVAKHERFLVKPIATGLWTRYGQPIQAPKWFLDQLPGIPLDGELWLGRNRWQETSSIVKCMDPRERDWREVKYMVFDSPPYGSIFAPGTINNTNFKKKIDADCMSFVRSRIGIGFIKQPFYKSYEQLKQFCSSESVKHGNVFVHQQTQINCAFRLIPDFVYKLLSEVEILGGEGIMLRNPISFWEPERTKNLLKVKRALDAEAEVVGYTWAKPSDVSRTVSGEATDKLVGLMGSLRCKFQDKEFDLSGFTDDEREMSGPLGDVRAIGRENPGERVQNDIENPKFPRGSIVTFKYRELSDSGIPKEARYFRERKDHA